MSIHIEAAKGAIAESILLPGDPLRAKFIAETFFQEPICFNQVRGMLGYTGLVGGQRVSVMGTGMGQPSLSIYVNELLSGYGVKQLIRVGTCGALQSNIHVRDIVLAMSSCTDSAVNKIRFHGMDFAPTADFNLLSRAHAEAIRLGATVHAGPILATDSFYAEDPEQWKLWARFGVLAVEMESAELYTLAAKFQARALSVLTVSDSLVDHEDSTSAERERSFSTMVQVALACL